MVRILAVVGVVGMLALLHSLLAHENRGCAWFYWPILATLSYRMLWWGVEWMYYTRPNFAEWRSPLRPWTVDVLTTACPGEPRGMILRTLKAMQAIRYPHESYLCDEGDDPVLKEACQILGVHHVTRSVKKDAKAGNINNALAQANGEIVVVLDPDHEPAPFLLDRVLGHFEAPEVGFVQSVQAYRNQNEGYVAEGAAKQTYLFYGPLMMGMNAYGTTQAIGANCVFRRSALDSIGGHAAGLSEDMHTTMRLYAKGWRSVYVPEILTRGLVPACLSSYCKQQIKWACGSIELLLREYPRLCRGMTGWQRLHYLLVPAYFLRGIASAIDIVVPILCLALGGTPLRLDPVDFCRIYLPIVLISALIRQRAQRWVIEESDRGAHFVGGLLAKGCWWVYLQGALSAFLRIKLPYIPTPKESQIQDCWRLVVPNLLAATASVCAVVYGLGKNFTPYSSMMAAIALMNAFQLTWVSVLGQQKTLSRLRDLYPAREHLWSIGHCLETAYLFFHGVMLRALRNSAVVVSAMLLMLIAFAYPLLSIRHGKYDLAWRVRDEQGFYTGVDFQQAAPGEFSPRFQCTAKGLGTQLGLYPLTQRWCRSDEGFPALEVMRAARLNGATPLVRWEPYTEGLRELVYTRIPLRRDEIFSAIVAGTFDEYLVQTACALREFGDPVLMVFAPEADKTGRSWSSLGADSGEIFTRAWEHVVNVFRESGASNVSWVWQPGSTNGFLTHLPNVTCIDWIAISLPRDQDLGGGVLQSFEELYAPFRERIRSLNLPVLLLGVELPRSDGAHDLWMSRTMDRIAAEFAEIRGVIFESSDIDAAVDRWFGNRELSRIFENPRLRALGSMEAKKTKRAEQKAMALEIAPALDNPPK